jgi:DNA polymerase II large subunit
MIRLKLTNQREKPVKKFKCKKCEKEVRTIALEVAHRCPKNKNLITRFEEVEEPKA